MPSIISYNSPMLLEKDYYAYIDAYYYQDWINFVTRKHAHHHIEVMYVAKGCCTIEVENHKYTLKKGDFILLNNSTFHRLTVGDTKCSMINVEFHFTDTTINAPSMKDILKHSDVINKLLDSSETFFLLKDNDNIHNILTALISTQSNPMDFSLMNQILIAELLAKISSMIDITNNGKQSGSIFYVRKAVKYMLENYDSPITIDNIATAACIHPAYLQKLFKQHMNCTIIDYLTDLRIEKSKIFLVNTNLLITDIPAYIGLNSVQYYTNLFKKKNHCTPLQYRKEHVINTKNGEYDSTYIYGE